LKPDSNQNSCDYMQPHADGASANDSELLAAKAFFRRVGTGWRVWSSDKRSLVAQMVSSKGWATRRSKYGPTGQRERSYKQWRAERNKPAIGDDGREIKQ